MLNDRRKIDVYGVHSNELVTLDDLKETDLECMLELTGQYDPVSKPCPRQRFDNDLVQGMYDGARKGLAEKYLNNATVSLVCTIEVIETDEPIQTTVSWRYLRTVSERPLFYRKKRQEGLYIYGLEQSQNPGVTHYVPCTSMPCFERTNDKKFDAIIFKDLRAVYVFEHGTDNSNLVNLAAEAERTGANEVYFYRITLTIENRGEFDAIKDISAKALYDQASAWLNFNQNRIEYELETGRKVTLTKHSTGRRRFFGPLLEPVKDFFAKAFTQTKKLELVCTYKRHIKAQSLQHAVQKLQEEEKLPVFSDDSYTELFFKADPLVYKVTTRGGTGNEYTKGFAFYEVRTHNEDAVLKWRVPCKSSKCTEEILTSTRPGPARLTSAAAVTKATEKERAFEAYGIGKDDFSAVVTENQALVIPTSDVPEEIRILALSATKDSSGYNATIFNEVADSNPDWPNPTYKVYFEGARGHVLANMLGSGRKWWSPEGTNEKVQILYWADKYVLKLPGSKQKGWQPAVLDLAVNYDNLKNSYISRDSEDYKGTTPATMKISFGNSQKKFVRPREDASILRSVEGQITNGKYLDSVEWSGVYKIVFENIYSVSWGEHDEEHLRIGRITNKNTWFTVTYTRNDDGSRTLVAERSDKKVRYAYSTKEFTHIRELFTYYEGIRATSIEQAREIVSNKFNKTTTISNLVDDTQKAAYTYKFRTPQPFMPKEIGEYDVVLMDPATDKKLGRTICFASCNLKN